MRRRYALAGLVAVISILSSFILVAAEPIEIGTLLAGRKPKKTWTFLINPDHGYTVDDIVDLHFFCDIEGTEQEVIISEYWYEGSYTVKIVLYKKDIPKTCDDTYVRGTIDDTTFWARGPGFLKRKWT